MTKKSHTLKFILVLLASFAIEIWAEKPTVKITASPSNIIAGGSSILTWASTGATSATCNNNIGSVKVNGSKVVEPDKTTTFTITVKNNSDIATDSITITVKGNLNQKMSLDQRIALGDLLKKKESFVREFKNAIAIYEADFDKFEKEYKEVIRNLSERSLTNVRNGGGIGLLNWAEQDALKAAKVIRIKLDLINLYMKGWDAFIFAETNLRTGNPKISNDKQNFEKGFYKDLKEIDNIIEFFDKNYDILLIILKMDWRGTLTVEQSLALNKLSQLLSEKNDTN